MPFDGVFTCAVVNELSALKEGKIDKVHQLSDQEIMLYIRKQRKPVKVLLCANPSYPRVQITNSNRENPKTPPNFCMVLRKYLLGARISDIYQVNFDRIVEFKIESKDELGYNKTFYLVSEIMGKHSNIILLNSERRIVDCIKHIDSSMNRYRQVIPGESYVHPPLAGKVDPLDKGTDKLGIALQNSLKTCSKVLCDTFLGMSRQMADEICGALCSSPVDSLTSEDKDLIRANFSYYFARIKSCDFTYILYSSQNVLKDYYVFPLKAYEDLSSSRLESTAEILDMFYSRKDTHNTIKQKYTEIFKLISNLIDRNEKKLQIHYDKLDECSDYTLYKTYGDILMANQFSIHQGEESVTLDNFYDPDMAEITIPLDKDLSPSANAQKYYKRYAKEKSTIEFVKKQIEDAEKEKDYLGSVLFNLESALDVETIEEIKRELIEDGYIKKKRTNAKPQKSSPLHYVSSDGYDIYVGKNNMQNDYLTLKFAVSSDVWMHTKDIHGSHVIIKSKSGTVSDAALLEGASLAAYYSKARSSANVPVDYTQKKNVKKPSGAKPGMVIYYTNKTIYVTPDEAKISNMKLG